MPAGGPSRHFAATQQFSRFRSEADIEVGFEFLRKFFSKVFGHAPRLNPAGPGAASKSNV
jgi:hypothetical protein